MPYTHNDWVAGENKFDIKTQADVAILSNVKINNIGVAGTAINPTNLNNVEDAVNSIRTFPTTGGTATAQTLTAYHATLAVGIWGGFIAGYSNGGVASTLNVNSLGVKSMYEAGTTNPPVIVAGQMYIYWYNTSVGAYYIAAYNQMVTLAGEFVAAVYALSNTAIGTFTQMLISGRTPNCRIADDSVAGCEATTGWSDYNGVSSTDSSNKFEGTYCLKLVLSATPPFSCNTSRDVLASLDITKYYLFTGYVKNGNAATGVGIFVNCAGDAGVISSSYSTATSYVRYGIAIQPSNFNTATNVYFALSVAGNASQYGYLDAFQVYEITAADYALCTSGIAPQALLDKYPFQFAKKGVAPQEIKSVGKNLVYNGNGEFGISGWTLNNTPVNPRFVSGYFEIEDNSAADSEGLYQTVRVQPSTTYKVSCTAKKGTVNARFLVYTADGALTSITTYNTSTDVLTDTVLSHSITTEANCVYLKIYILAGAAASDTGIAYFKQIQAETGSTVTSYEAQYLSVSYTPELHNTPNVQDTYDALTGVHTQNTTYDADVSGAQFDALVTTMTNCDYVYTSAFALAKSGVVSAVNGFIRWYDKNGLEATETRSNLDDVSQVGKAAIAGQRVYVFFAKGAYADIAAARTGLGTCAVRYALAAPTITTYPPRTMNCPAQCTLMQQSIIADYGFYDSTDNGIEITDTTYPISSLAEVVIIDADTGAETPIAISTCTVAAGGLSFTSTALANGDLVWFRYYYTFSLSTVGEVDFTRTANSIAQISEHAQALADITKQQEKDRAINQAQFSLADATIRKTGLTLTQATWVDDTGVSGFWKYTVTDADVTADDNVDIDVDTADIVTALPLTGKVEEGTGEYHIYAHSEPAGDIGYKVRITREGV